MTPDSPLEVWQRLLDPESAPLLAAARDVDPRNVSELARLRADWAPDLVSVALELMRARTAASRKLFDPDRWVADVPGVEQATSGGVARHKARRYEMLAPACIFDLCCGIGGDARALASVAPVIAVDRDPVRAWMTDHNVGCEVRCADVGDLELRGEVVHIDPARRRGSRRAWCYEDYEPAPDVLERILDDNPNAAVKLGPGVDLRRLPIGDEGEVELLSEAGTLVQAVLWRGELAHRPGLRTATRLPDGVSLSAPPGSPEVLPTPDFDRFLLEPDPAVERAELLRAVALPLRAREVAPGLGILTASSAGPSPWLRAFEVVEVLPWRLPKVRAWLRQHDGGVVEVKTRGKTVDPQEVRRQVRGQGDSRFTLFVLRLGHGVRAVVTRRCDI